MISVLALISLLFSPCFGCTYTGKMAQHSSCGSLCLSSFFSVFSTSQIDTCLREKARKIKKERNRERSVLRIVLYAVVCSRLLFLGGLSPAMSGPVSRSRTLP